MSDLNINYNLQFDKLCGKLNLGKIIHEPVSVSGGHLHRMYCVITDKGKYAVKTLNPQVMARPKAYKNITDGELAALIAGSEKKIAVSSAEIFDAEKTPIQELDGQFYVIYDWIDGKSIFSHEITPEHCRKIAYSLAMIHQTDFSSIDFYDEYSVYESYIDWKFYLEKGVENNAEWVKVLSKNVDKLNRFYSVSVEAGKVLSSDTVIGHGDLEPKNVMWTGDNPVIIDWEAAGIINPVHDLIETAVYWSKNDDGSVNHDKFVSFVSEYKRCSGITCSDWKPALNIGFAGKMGWLEYSLRRSLGIESADADERKMGTSHVFYTIDEILQYADMTDVFESWLSEIF